nr:ADVGHVFLRFamide [Locusta migratoria]prf//2018310B FMRFamide-related peptide [Locusta migratoria]
ADVGHVFLRF